jgi:hypothetical protein
MILRQIKISELGELCSSPEYASWTHVPISPARAHSQSLNPDALPEDNALFIALDDVTGNVLAYAGAYPSKIKIPETTRFAWNSCWWVAGGEGGDTAMKVFFSFLKTWEKKVAFSDMTGKTFKIVQNLGFCHTMTRNGVVLNIRPGISSRLRVLSSSDKKLRFYAKPVIFSGIPWLADSLANIFLYFPQKLNTLFFYHYKPVKLAFPEEKDFECMQVYGAKDFHIPDAEELKMPLWLVKPDMRNKFLTKKYYFSSFACHFSTFWLRWESEGRPDALVMFSLRDGVLKTLYVYCSSDFSARLPGAIIAFCYANPRIRTLVTAQPVLTKFISKRKFFILSRENFTRYSAVSKDLMKLFDNEPVLQDGDGDYRFT